MGDHRKLEVWRLGCTQSDNIDILVATLPRRTQKGLGDQLCRAAESIHMNIAEGCGLNSDPQLAKHIRIALGSANEVEDGLMKLDRRGLLPRHQHSLIDDATLLRRKLGAFLKKLGEDQDN
jgi:four helix bundle protein